jgi:NAD dependent epimerase/dehydratase
MAKNTYDVASLRVLVTGADGFIGSHLAERLARSGANVRALACYNSFGRAGWLDTIDPALFDDRLSVVHGDIRDPYFVSKVIEDVDIVFHLAALIAIPFSYVAPHSYIETNINGTLNVLEACRQHGTKRLVHTSTSEVYGTAQFTPITETHPLQGQSPYSASKIGADHLAESYFRSFDVPVVTLRPFNTFGPRQSERAVIPSVIRQILDPACLDIKVGDLSPVRDFNYVEDIADAFIYLAMAEGVEFGTAYNAGTGIGVTIGETVDILREATGTQKPVVAEASRRRPSKSEVFTLIAATNRIHTATNWTPNVGLKNGLAKTTEWWRAEIAAGRQRLDTSYQT